MSVSNIIWKAVSKMGWDPELKEMPQFPNLIPFSSE